MINKSSAQNKVDNILRSSISRPLIMGILNITPDSFYDGNAYKDQNITSFISKYNYSDIIDVGCESSRPGSRPVEPGIQIDRLNFFLRNLKKLYKFPLSIDSTEPEVIEYALESGFSIINDISAGGENYENFNIAKDFNSTIIIMHMQKNPYNMQDNPNYINVVDDVKLFFEEKIDIALSMGLKKKQLILDPGFGFGKTINHNFELLREFDEFKKLKCKLMAGLSRKSFLSTNENQPEDRLLESLFAAQLLLTKSINIIRVHDINETRRLINFSNKVNGYGN